MLSLNTDINDLILQRTLMESTLGLNQTINRLTTGYKLIHSKDNAAGYSIATDLNKKISSMLMIQQNASEGIDLISTAEGGLDQILTQLQRLRALSIDAANGTYDVQSRDAMQAEVDSIMESIDAIKSSTSYNNINLLESVSYTNNSAETAPDATFSLRTTSPQPSPQGEESDSGITLMSLDDTTEPLLTSPSGEEGVNTSGHTTLDAVSQGLEVEEFSSLEVEQNLQSLPLLAGEGEGEVETTSMTYTMMRSATPASTTIDGSVDFAAGETKTLTIDGVEYIVTNNATSNSSLTFSKDTETGVLTFQSTYMTIRGQTDVAHTVIIFGLYNNFFGGNLDDIIQESTSSSATNGYNYLHGGNGEDTIYLRSKYSVAFGEGDNDNIYLSHYSHHTTVFGGDGDDTIDLQATEISCFISGGAGNDSFIATNGASSSSFLGGDGDDSFVLNSVYNSTIIGGSGSNTLSQTNCSNLSTTDFEDANFYGLEIVAGESATAIIDGREYTFFSECGGLITWNIDTDGQITFVWVYNNSRGDEYLPSNRTPEEALLYSYGNFLQIYGQTNISHNIYLNSQWMAFHGGTESDTIKTGDGGFNLIYSGDGDDDITIGGAAIVYAEEGNDNITIKNYNANNSIFIDSGLGDDNINNTTSYVSTDYDIIIDSNGTNTLTDTSSTLNLIETGGEVEFLSLGAKETKEVIINGKTYTFRNLFNEETTLAYSYDSDTDFVNIYGHGIVIDSQDDLSHNIKTYGQWLVVNGGSKNDTIVGYSYYSRLCGNDGDDSLEARNTVIDLYGYSGNDNLSNITGTSNITMSGGEGNDIIYIENGSRTSSINGGDGNDIYYLNAATSTTDSGGDNTYYINANGTNVTGGNGADTFYVNSANNTVNGGGGDDHFVIDNTGSNTINGGTGTNTAIDNSGGAATLINISSDPNSGILNFYSANETQNLTINGITYSFKNTGADGTSPANNTLMYSYNPTTGELRVEGTNFTITSTSAAKLLVRGDNNKITGTSGNDSIKIESGSNNIVDGGGGNDVLTAESANNSLLGGDGNDTITLNAGSDKEINGGNGTDSININSNNNSNIISENDTITGTGNSNTITLSGGSIDLSGSYNNISTDGSSLSISGNGNSISSTNELDGTVIGDGNIITSSGNTDLIIQGENNDITTGSGNDTISYNGSNTISTNGGNDTLSDNTTGSFSSSINFAASGEVNTLIVRGQKFQITNNNAAGADLGYSYDEPTNTVTFTGNGFDIVALTTANAIVNGNNNNVVGSSGSDNITINGSNNTLDGGAGNDKLNISGDNNTLNGGNGDDTITVDGTNNLINGGADNDVIIDSGNNTTINGDDGADKITVSGNGVEVNGGAGNDTITDNGSNNTLNGEDGADTINLNGTGSTANGGDGNDNIILNGENNTANGGNDDDKITSNSGNNVLNGGNGNDTITSKGENNTIDGGAGNDTINLDATTNKDVIGGDGDDTVNLGLIDNANIDLGSGNDKVTGSGSNNTIIGGDGNDKISINGNENVIDGGNGDNNIGITGDNNTISTGNGDDSFNIVGDGNSVNTTGGDNVISVNGDSNIFNGGDGKDKVTVNGDSNVINGGAGNDTISINGGANNVIDGGSGNNIVNDAGEGTTATNTMTAVYKPFELRLKVGIGYDENSYLRATLDLGLLSFEVDLSTQETAWDAVSKIDEAIESIQNQMTQLGALTNRLECIMEEQSVQLNSMISSRSTIMDADIAEESSKYIRYQILQQASATLLSTSRNLRAENVLGLLQGLRR